MFQIQNTKYKNVYKTKSQIQFLEYKITATTI